jgi:hypothetical protein
MATAGPTTAGSSDGSTNQWPSMARESPTLQSQGQTAASKKGYDYYQAKSDMSAAGKLRESPTLPSKGQTSVRESPTEPAGIRESPTEPSRGGEEATMVRESPSKASLGRTSVRESPTLPSRDQATGQASGKRSGIGDTAPQPPLGISDVTDRFETGDIPTEEQATGQASGEPSGTDHSQETPQGEASMVASGQGKKEFKGHVTLLK